MTSQSPESRKKRVKRVVLGVGYGWFPDEYEIRLMPKKDNLMTMNDECKRFRGFKLLDNKKIRLIAEVIE